MIGAQDESIIHIQKFVWFVIEVDPQVRAPVNKGGV